MNDKNIFKNLIKLNIFKLSAVKNCCNNMWDNAFASDVIYQSNHFKHFKKFFKDYKKFKKMFNIDKCAKVYNLLSDEYSKSMYIKVLLYWLYKDNRVEYPHAYELGLTDFYKKYDYLIMDDTQINVTNGTLHKYDLSPLNYNLKIIFGNKLAFYYVFIKEQYNYRNMILPKKGDIIIDGGGCYGDTALYFADKLKGDGHIYSFEISQKNAEIFKQNLELNPHYKSSVTIVNNAISDKEETLYFNYNASMTKCESEQKSSAQEVSAVSIDKFVEDNNIQKVDYIKLDIEGKEIQALKGAVKTIKKFKPKLAICLYHNISDLWNIPLFINKIIGGGGIYIQNVS